MGTEDDHLELRRVKAEIKYFDKVTQCLNSFIIRLIVHPHFQAIFKHQKVDIIVATESYYSGRPTWLNHKLYAKDSNN